MESNSVHLLPILIVVGMFALFIISGLRISSNQATEVITDGSASVPRLPATG
jgi:hypothetical protein